MLITLFSIGGLSDCIGWANTGIYDSSFAELGDLKVRLLSGRQRYLWGEARFLVSSAVCPENGRRKDFKFQKPLQAWGYKQALPVRIIKDLTVTTRCLFFHTVQILLEYALWGDEAHQLGGIRVPKALRRWILKKETWSKEEEMKGLVKLMQKETGSGVKNIKREIWK